MCAFSINSHLRLYLDVCNLMGLCNWATYSNVPPFLPVETYVSRTKAMIPQMTGSYYCNLQACTRLHVTTLLSWNRTVLLVPNPAAHFLPVAVRVTSKQCVDRPQSVYCYDSACSVLPHFTQGSLDGRFYSSFLTIWHICCLFGNTPPEWRPRLQVLEMTQNKCQNKTTMTPYPGVVLTKCVCRKMSLQPVSSIAVDLFQSMNSWWCACTLPSMSNKKTSVEQPLRPI